MFVCESGGWWFDLLKSGTHRGIRFSNIIGEISGKQAKKRCQKTTAYIKSRTTGAVFPEYKQ